MRRLAAVSALLAWSLAPAMPARATAPVESSRSIEQFVDRAAAAEVLRVAPAARLEVELGRLDQRLQLAACVRVEPFVPAGVRLWGRAHIGLRCADSGAGAARWQVYLPVNVRVFGPALVAARPIAAGHSLGADDFTTAEVELTRDPHGVLTDLAQAEGRVSSRPLAAGQPVPLVALRAPQVVAAGDQVRIVGRGAGFSITAQAVALAAANDGDTVRVRLDSGRVLTGTARAGRRVDVHF
jgi:flagella basal body P-ring formation protein FlgA